ncbi:hypothetical protein SAY87_009865 [Trapa incisa]|uniref:Pentatricopeptide repeat-containing protein n=1 Tax=Trapa incisa TaxID=236973 RepID=A0AAN7PYR1_9MYRT|nr:hypothetical protein SAY87_009865 [Trapa incisa]
MQRKRSFHWYSLSYVSLRSFRSSGTGTTAKSLPCFRRLDFYPGKEISSNPAVVRQKRKKYARSGLSRSDHPAGAALRCLNGTQGTPFSEFTLSSVLCACAAKCALLECKQLHALSVKAIMDDNVFVATALLDLYAKCGLINDASSLFEFMQNRTDVTWSSMVAGYVRNELYEEALVLFRRGQVAGIEHNQFTISSIEIPSSFRAMDDMGGFKVIADNDERIARLETQWVVDES